MRKKALEILAEKAIAGNYKKTLQTSGIDPDSQHGKELLNHYITTVGSMLIPRVANRLRAQDLYYTQQIAFYKNSQGKTTEEAKPLALRDLENPEGKAAVEAILARISSPKPPASAARTHCGAFTAASTRETASARHTRANRRREEDANVEEGQGKQPISNPYLK